jgi:hypothetical protein
MNPAFIMLLVVALVFVGFASLPKRKEPNKTTDKSSFSGVAQDTGRHQPFIVSKPSAASEGTGNNELYPKRHYGA